MDKKKEYMELAKVIEADFHARQDAGILANLNNKNVDGLHVTRDKILKDMTSAKKLPFGIEASSGFVIAVDNSRSLDDYINEADEHMYQAKKRHKAQRD